MEPPSVCTGLRKLKIAPYEKMNALCKSAIGMFNKVRGEFGHLPYAQLNVKR